VPGVLSCDKAGFEAGAHHGRHASLLFSQCWCDADFHWSAPRCHPVREFRTSSSRPALSQTTRDEEREGRGQIVPNLDLSVAGTYIPLVKFLRLRARAFIRTQTTSSAHGPYAPPGPNTRSAPPGWWLSLSIALIAGNISGSGEATLSGQSLCRRKQIFGWKTKTCLERRSTVVF